MERAAIQRQVAEFQRAYMDDPDFLDRQYEVPSLTEVLVDPGVVGVARFIELPSFAAERLFTFVYRPTLIQISAVIGASSLWYSKPAVYEVGGTGEWEVQEGERFDPGQAWRQSAVCELQSEACPPLLRSWASLRAAAVDAGCCSTSTLDGIGYRHRLADREFRSDADWDNPDPREHAPQIVLIEAYVQLLRGVGVYPEVPTSQAVPASIDWDAKEQLAKAREEERAQRPRAWLDAIEAHNHACREFFSARGPLGLTCPHCRRQSTDIQFVDRAADERKSCFVCRACGRSFGHDL